MSTPDVLEGTSVTEAGNCMGGSMTNKPESAVGGPFTVVCPVVP